MQVTLLYFAGCPNWKVADERLREALRRVGLSDVAVQRRAVETPEAAEALRFPGSPTVLVDGQDVFGDAPAAALACRVYQTPAGPAGSPTVEQLVDVLRAHRSATSNSGTTVTAKGASAVNDSDPATRATSS